MDARFQCYLRDGAIMWRLLGRNNRSLARSVIGFTGVDLAQADAATVAEVAPHAPMDLVSDGGSAWRWVLLVDDVARATSGTTYARRLECVRAVDRFRRAAATAEVSRELLPDRARRLAGNGARFTIPPDATQPEHSSPVSESPGSRPSRQP